MNQDISTMQSYYNAFLRHFIVAAAPLAYVISPGGRKKCKYRVIPSKDSGPSARCAVGLFIPDVLYTPAMEGVTVSFLSENFPELMLPGKDTTPGQFLRALQELHDNVLVESDLDRRNRLATVIGSGRLANFGINLLPSDVFQNDEVQLAIEDPSTSEAVAELLGSVQARSWASEARARRDAAEEAIA